MSADAPATDVALLAMLQRNWPRFADRLEPRISFQHAARAVGAPGWSAIQAGMVRLAEQGELTLDWRTETVTRSPSWTAAGA